MFVVNFWHILRCLPKVSHYWRKSCKHNGVSKQKGDLTDVCYYLQRSTNNIKSFLVNSSVCQNISANLPQTVQFGKGRYYTKWNKQCKLKVKWPHWVYVHRCGSLPPNTYNNSTFCIYVYWNSIQPKWGSQT